MSAWLTSLCLTFAIISGFNQAKCPEQNLEDPKDPYAFYQCGVRQECPSGTAFDATQKTCTESKWKSIQDEPKHRSKRATDDQLKVVCYFINWGIYRKETANFTPEDVDPFLCTHIIYAFAKLDENSLTMMPSDPNSDIGKQGYKKVVELKKKNPKLKVLLAIGGWTDSKGDKYSRMVRDSDKRKEFVEHAVEMLKEHKFDGLDLDWEYPVCWQGDCPGGRKSDKKDFADLLKDLRKAFDKEKPRLLLSAAVYGGKYISDEAYDAESMNKNLDFVNVMAYDLYDSKMNKTQHHASFKYHEGDANKYFNVMASMKYWHENRKISKKKLILGVPAYGRTFTLDDPSHHGLFDPAAYPGVKGEFTGEAGVLSYVEILERITERGWKVDRVSGVGPFAYEGNQWVGYDDLKSAKEKGQFVRDKGYGGVMVWELSSDDFRKLLSKMKSPLIHSLKDGLENGATFKTLNLALVAAVLLCHLKIWKSFV